MLKSKYRLNTAKDINKLYKNGFRFRGVFVSLIIVPELEKNDNPKFGFIVSKKLGNAVVRHKYQRRLRYIVFDYLKEKEQELKSLKCVLIAYKNPENYSDLKIEVVKLFDSAIRKYGRKKD